MRNLVTLLERVTGGLGALAAVIVLPLIFATCYEVFARYVFGAPTIWAFELGYTLTGCHFLLGAALTLQRGSHIRIDVIYAHFGERTKAWVDLVFYVCLFLPFLVLLSNALLTYSWKAYASGETSGASAWNPPIWPFRLVIAAGFILLALQVLAEVLKAVMVLRGQSLKGLERG